MKKLFCIGCCLLCLTLAACAKNGDPVGAGIGDSTTSGGDSGAGGDGSGPTGTQGSEPADDVRQESGTGTDAPSP